MLGVALKSRKTPSTIALTRQNLPTVRTEYIAENMCAYGAYELAAASGKAEVTIFATGSEVEIALNARTQLEKDGHPTRVVSVPCFELFEQTSDEYKRVILGDAPVKIAVEAAIRMGWDRFIGIDGIFRRDDRLWRQRPDRSTVRAFRYHRGPYRRSGGSGKLK